MREQQIQKIGVVFSAEERKYRQGPQRNRTCNDICCLITFLLIGAAYLGIGLYYITTRANVALTPSLQAANFFVEPIATLKQIIIDRSEVVGGSLSLSVVLSIFFMFLTRYCTKCMVYFTLFSAILLMAGVLAISVLSSAWGTLIAISIFLFIFIVMLICYRSYIEIGSIMLRAAMQFLIDRPRLSFLPIIKLFIMIGVLVFWSVSMICMQYDNAKMEVTPANKAMEIAFYIFWVFGLVYITTFFYYSAVYIVSGSCSFWYYGKEQMGFCSSLGWLLRGHLGSVTFVSLLSFLLKLIQFLGSAAYRKQQVSGNSLACCCYCFFKCCFDQIGYTIQILNKFTVISLPLTGSGIIPTSKFCLSVLSRDFRVFLAIKSLSQLLKFASVIFTSGIPTLSAYLAITLAFEKSYDSYTITILILLVFLVSLMISYIFVSMWEISLCSVLFYFCLDRRYRDIGQTIDNTPEVLRDLQYTGKFEYEIELKSAERLF